jgi:hypothetical protein
MVRSVSESDFLQIHRILEPAMSLSKGARWLVPGIVLSGLLLSAAPSEEPSKVESLGKARLDAAQKQFDETWAYYQQARIDTYQVYVWSRMILDCRREMSPKPADRIAALEEHLARMKKLEALVTRVRRIGFGRSYDVGAALYYRLECEHWIELERAKK